MKLIVTIPALNEAATIADVIREIPRRIAGIDAVEVLVVDDGSRDQTAEEARRAGARLRDLQPDEPRAGSDVQARTERSRRARRRHHRQHRRR